MTPPSPSYARSTAASLSRMNPRANKTSGSVPSSAIPKKLKRPSTLSDHDRQRALLLSFQAEMLTIKPANPQKPCMFALLPTEVREMIYDYILPSFEVAITTSRRQNRILRPDRSTKKSLSSMRYNHYSLWPPLLRTSRRIRLEAAYIFYSHTSFSASVREFNFSAITCWVESLPVTHRQFLTRNSNLVINIDVTETRGRNTNHELWNECRNYGNLYVMQGTQHQRHLVSFRRLADWWLWCSKPSYKDLTWKYMLGSLDWVTGEWATNWRLSITERWMKEELTVFAAPCVSVTNVTAKQKSLMKKEALKMMDDINAEFAKINRGVNVTVRVDWDKRMKPARRILEQW